MSDALTEKLTRALADLGDTPEAVAAYLEGQGVRGYKQNGGNCPVAVYLRSTFGTQPFVLCTGSWTDEDSSVSGYVDNPRPVSLFIDRFDAGHYPQLEAR